jgi:rhodanese-related sulfurtransferase
MGLIDQGWYLVIIFLIGLFFGLVLEQSGFSSSRKLAGVFYGYDFVVLKVFFTAGITAMSGLVILGYFGVIDLSAIYVNSNFLLPAVLGGVIMGFGFILGGFCPGTSLTGAVIGKIDAMVFIVGIFLGIFLFGSFDATFHKLFTGYYFDGELISDTLGIGKHLMVFIWIAMALVAFGVATWFEKRSTKGLRPTNQRYPKMAAEVTLALAIGVIILFLPPVKAKGIFEKNENSVLNEVLSDDHRMDADELAYLIIHNPKKIVMVDVRNQADYTHFSLPGSINIPIDQVTNRAHHDLFRNTRKKVILISNGGVEASKAAVLLARKGHMHVQVLEGGMNQLVKTVFEENTPPEGLTAFDQISKYKFRQRAAAFFREGLSDIKMRSGNTQSKPAPAPAVRPMAGGC